MPSSRERTRMELPEVLDRKREGDLARLELHIAAGLGWFAGHFPGHPILPGVVQIGWVIHFAAEMFGLGREVVSMEQIKFRRPIGPGTRLALTLRQDGRLVEYALAGAGVTYASGRLRFEGRS